MMKNKALLQHKFDIFLMTVCIFTIIALSGCCNHNQSKNWVIWPPPDSVKDIEPPSVFVDLCFSESSEIELSPILFNNAQTDFAENSNKKLKQFEKLLTTQPDMRIRLDGPDALENKVKSYFLKKNIDRNRIITTSDCPYQCWEDFIENTGDQILGDDGDGDDFMRFLLKITTRWNGWEWGRPLKGDLEA